MRRSALVLALLIAIFGAAQAVRADGIEVRSQSVQNKFPGGLQFQLFVAASGDITDARLRYKLLPLNVETSIKATCTQGSVSNCTALLGNTFGTFLFPGATIDYSWDLQDSAGGTLRTPEARATYQDDRFRWDSKTSGKVTVYFYSGSDQTITSVLQSANESVERMSKLLNTQVDFPLKVWLYKNASDLRAASQPQSGATGGILEGQQVAGDTVLSTLDPSPLDTVRHELTHVVVARASRGYLGEVPLWINEGLAVFSQRQFDAGWTASLELAKRRNQPIPVEILGGNSIARGTDFSLFYGESGSIISFMVSKYGDQKFGEFFAVLRSNTVGGALKQVYGLDEEGLENAWRASIGLPALAPAGTRASGSNERSLPTIVPFGAANQPAAATPAAGGGQTGEQTAKSGGGSSNSVVIVVGALTALAVLGILGGGLWVARRTKS